LEPPVAASKLRNRRESRKIVIGAALLFIGLPIVLVSVLYASFYSVFYFPNRSSAIAGTVISSGENRKYLLYVPKSCDRAKPTPLVISLHTSMSWPTSAMDIRQCNLVADDQGVIVVYPAGSGSHIRWEGLSMRSQFSVMGKLTAVVARTAHGVTDVPFLGTHLNCALPSSPRDRFSLH
jgi:poly(3-hydroxybutyrate) depolymerase